LRRRDSSIAAAPAPNKIMLEGSGTAVPPLDEPVPGSLGGKVMAKAGDAIAIIRAAAAKPDFVVIALSLFLKFSGSRVPMRRHDCCRAEN
jgi:hypothetical protein